MLRGLILMNPLVIDKISKKFHFYKDSGFIYTKQLLKSLPDEYRITWLVPEQVIKNDSEKKWFLESHPNIELVAYPYPTSIHRNRYDFYGKNILDSFPYTRDLDFIINNQPELSGSIRTLFDTAKREKPIILNFFHWIDCNESREFGEDLGGYFYRQLEGFIASDFSCFHNEYAFSLFKNEFKQRFGESGKDLTELKKEKVLYFTPAATKFGNEPVDVSFAESKKIIMFNHRLNKSTRWKEVISILGEIYKTRKDFLLWITDDSNKESSRVVKSFPFVHVQKLPFENYGFILNKSHFSICNHKGYSTWNMAVIDSLLNNCVSLVPNREVYINMFENSDYLKLYSHNNKKDLKEKIIELLDCDKIETFNILNDKNLQKLFTPNDSIFKEKILNLIKNRIPENKPAKYDKVLNLIKNKKEILKKEIINSLWSFHCNSNFQKIRWNLIAKDGIIDDTLSKETLYRYKK